MKHTSSSYKRCVDLSHEDQVVFLTHDPTDLNQCISAINKTMMILASHKAMLVRREINCHLYLSLQCNHPSLDHQVPCTKRREKNN
ncbi:hypothetical protein HanPSC8_Chr14g0633281 [Helianthus annuus]|nr:hypothetical protein HanPSC8_Chr14g0633281 [Helianthus annuus]